MKTELVIFDLDGTLLDTIEDLAASTNHTLALHGYPTHPLESFRYFVGNGISKLIERSLPESERNEATILRLRSDFVAYYSQHNSDLTHPYPEIPALLQALQERGVRMAVASNKYQAATEQLVLRYFGAHTFCKVLGQREGVPIKPDPTIVFDILKETGIAPEQTLYLGDTRVDMETAQHSDVTSVGVTWGFRPRAELEAFGAHHLIDTPSQLLALPCF
ncbi:MAG: HAD family hydrolase [Alistipes sp.]|nr:HAD family hydrolase [Alistipes sp.]